MHATPPHDHSAQSNAANSANPTPQRILDTAVRCVAERGAAALSLADVAAAAGVSKGLIHYHFRDKETLLTRLVDELGDGLVAREREALSRVAPASALDGLWGWLARELGDGTIRVLLEVSLAPSPQIRAAAQRAATLRRDAAARTVAQLFSLLGLRPRLPASLLAEASVAFTDGLAMETAIGGMDGPRDPRVSFDAFWLSMLSLAE